MTGPEPTQLIPLVRGGRRGQFLENDEMEVVGTETETESITAAVDIAAVEAETVIATETEKTAAMSMNVGVVVKTETRIVAGGIVTVIERKGTTGSDGGRGKTTQRTLPMQKEREAMTDPMLQVVPILETRKEGTQSMGKTVTALARIHVNLRNDLRRVPLGKLFIAASTVIDD